MLWRLKLSQTMGLDINMVRNCCTGKTIMGYSTCSVYLPCNTYGCIRKTTFLRPQARQDRRTIGQTANTVIVHGTVVQADTYSL